MADNNGKIADNHGESTSWWQWLANTAGGIYTTKLGADVAIEQSKAQQVLANQQTNNELSFLGYTLHKNTLLWVAGGLILTSFMLILLKKR